MISKFNLLPMLRCSTEMKHAYESVDTEAAAWTHQIIQIHTGIIFALALTRRCLPCLID